MTLYPYNQTDVSRLIPYARNARTHSDAQVAQIAASIREFGFINPVIVDGSSGIIAGHGRVLAARKLGMKQVPTLEVSGLTEAQKRAYILADNKLALNAGWDSDMLKVELADLAGEGFNLDVIGFSADELNALMSDKTTGLTDPDDTPGVQAQEVTRLGDTWVLGKHRLRCGDSTVATDVEALLNGVQPHLMVTDPPYGVNYDPKWRERYDQFKRHATGKVENDDRADWTEAWSLFPGDVAYIWHGGLHSAAVQQSLETAGFAMRAQIIWVKQHFVFSRGDYHWQHEPCWYAVRSKGKGHWAGDRKQATVWQIQNHNPMGGKAEGSTGHGTQKPVECMKRPIENNSSPGQAVYEPFSGSGTTIIAAEQTGRACYAMELSPAYVDVAVRRWQQFTGNSATLEATGQPFTEVEHAAEAA